MGRQNLKELCPPRAGQSAKARIRRVVAAKLPHPPQPNRPLRRRRIDHGAALGDLQFTAGDHAACGSSGRFHQFAPPLPADLFRRVGRADRGIRGPCTEQRNDCLLKPEVCRADSMSAAGGRAVLHRIPVVRPLRAPLDAPPARGARLDRPATGGVRIGGCSLTVGHAFYPAGLRGPGHPSGQTTDRRRGRDESSREPSYQ